MVAAVVQDGNGDFRADRVRLTFSERVRHTRDVDGRYPFVVAGYRISSVAAAAGRTVVVALVERSSVDGAVRPSVRYRPTASKPVTDWAGNQARGQMFRARAHGRVPSAPPTSGPPPLPPPPAANLDPDGDGFPAPADCQPTNAAVNPRAADLPELAFMDSNCDGIDGTEANAIFVSPLGNDANPGTKASPKREIGAAVAVAAAAKRYVLAAEGSYGRVVAATGVDIYGGYDPTTWSRSAARISSVVGAPEGILATGATGVLLQQLSVRGNNAGPGTSAYGIRAIDGSSLTLQRVTVTAGDGAAGTAGTNGRAGADGVSGSGQTSGGCNYGGGLPGLQHPGLDGGRGGNNPVGAAGGAGWPGQFGTPGGSGGKEGRPGGDGGNGKDGEPGRRGGGDGGLNGRALAGVVWVGAVGQVGAVGANGNGGGGGGGAGGKSYLNPLRTETCGNPGGGGGAGGASGGSGEGGRGGGGSFGAYVYNATLVADASSITSRDGGVGGQGGNGGSGGGGGAGGSGGPAGKTFKGGDGGSGGNGGQGGAGGGGGGGPSIAVMKAGSSNATLTDTRLVFGKGGPGGPSGTGGSGTPVPSQGGIAQAIYP